MMARVSVILRRHPVGDLPRCLASLLDQTDGRWEAIVVMPVGAGHDEPALRSLADEPRFTIVHTHPAGGFNEGLARARGDFVLFLDSRDWLGPNALTSLLASVERSPGSIAFGRFEHRGPEGEPLGGPAALPESFTLAELLTCQPVPLTAQLFPRAALPADPFRAKLDHANAAYDLMLRLAFAGGTWRGADELVAYPRLRAPARADELHAMLRRRLELLSSAHHADCPAARDLRTALAMLSAASATGEDINETAHSLLRAAGELDRLFDSGHARDEVAAATSAGAIPVMPGVETPRNGTAVSPLLLAPLIWWQRTGFLGPLTAAAIAHARTGLASVVGSHDRAPALILDLAEEKTAGRPIILLGLGRNGRRIAREMARRGMPVRARDDALASPPVFAREEEVDIALIAPAEPWDTQAVHLMSVLDDDPFMRKVPPGVEVIRWRDALAHIDADRERWLASWASRSPAA